MLYPFTIKNFKLWCAWRSSPKMSPKLDHNVTTRPCGQKTRKSFFQQKTLRSRQPPPPPPPPQGDRFWAFSRRLPRTVQITNPGLPKSIVEFEQCHNFMIYFSGPCREHIILTYGRCVGRMKQKMPGSGGEEFLWKIRQITDAKICQKINGHSQARPQDATVGEVIEYGERRTVRCPRYRPSWKWLPEPEPWSWAILDTGMMLVPSYFYSHVTVVLWSFRYSLLAADAVFVLRILIS